jgi:hypothetical protein
MVVVDVIFAWGELNPVACLFLSPFLTPTGREFEFED